MMRAIRNVEEYSLAADDRHHQRHIGEVGAAGKRIVQGDDVAGREFDSSSAAATAIGIEPRCTGM